VSAAVLGYFGVKTFAGIIEGAADLESAMSRVKAATGAGAAEMKLLRKAAEEASARSKFTAVEAAGALENLAKAGLSATDAVSTLPAVLNLAQAGDVDLATSAEYVTKAINGLGLAVGDAARVADVLALGANATNTSVSGLAQALSYAAPLANTLGLSLEQTVAIIGKFADAGIDASRAGTALNSIMAQFSDPASRFRTELAAAGITTTNFDEALHALAKGGPGAERAIAAVGTEAGPALRALLNQGIGKLDELTLKLGQAEGSAAAAAKVLQDNLKGSLGGLGSAWEAVTNALGTPVLPVLKDGVDQLAGALRSAVSDGTVGRFGTAIATAFQGGIRWVREFVGGIDFAAVIAKAQSFADKVGAAFDTIGEKARTTSAVLQTAWGVASAGVNTVLSVVYLLAEAFSGVASNIMSGIALMMEKLSQISFGSVSAAFEQAAEQARESADGLAGVSEEFARRSGAAFDAAAEGANTAQAGWAALTQTADSATAAAGVSTKAYADMATTLQATAEANAAAADKTRLAAAAQELQAIAAERARAAQQELQAQYREAIATGNVQRAAEVMVKLRTATDAAAAAASNNTKKQQEQAKAIEAAFARMGLQTRDALRVAAQTAMSDFQMIRDSGQASADAIAAAWSKAAQAAIDANEGVVPDWVAAEAATRGYAVQLDEAGKATLQLVQTSAALKGLVGDFNAAAGAASGYGRALGGIRAPGGGGGGGGGRGGPGAGHGGGRGAGHPTGEDFGLDPREDRRGQAAGVIGPNQDVHSNLGDSREQRLGGQNAVDNRLMFLLRDKLTAGALTADDVGDLQAVIASLKQNAIQNAQVDRHGAAQISMEGRRDDLAWQNTMRRFEDEVARLTGTAASAAAGNTYVTHLRLDGGGSRRLSFADRESQQSANDLLRDLVRSRSVARS